MGKAVELRYCCDQCPKAFGRRGDLTRHLNIHRGIKPFACKTCQKRFAQLSGLKTHENVHNGNKPYICKYDGCSASFGDPSSCARHRKETHRRTQPYSCPIAECNSRIKRRSAFAAHLLKKHNIKMEDEELERCAPPLLPATDVKTEDEPTLVPFGQPRHGKERSTVKHIIPINAMTNHVDAPTYTHTPTVPLSVEFKDQFSGFGEDALPVSKYDWALYGSFNSALPEPDARQLVIEPMADIFADHYGTHLPCKREPMAIGTTRNMTEPDTSLQDPRVEFQGHKMYVMDPQSPARTPPAPHPSPVEISSGTGYYGHIPTTSSSLQNAIPAKEMGSSFLGFDASQTGSFEHGHLFDFSFGPEMAWGLH